MSAPDLLVVVCPAARHIDGESVRIARDVLRAGAPGLKLCLPEHREDLAGVLSRRGSRRPVVVGDDRALLCAVQLLHRERLAGGRRGGRESTALAVVPVGTPSATALAAGLGLPTDAVHAARAVLEGAERRLDLLVEDTGTVVLGPLRIPASRGQVARTAPGGVRGALNRCVSAIRPGRPPTVPPPRLRVEADGVVLAEPGRPVREVSVSTWTGGGTGGGLAEVVVRPAAMRSGSAPVTARARAVTVSGPDVRTRTWTVAPSALRLTVPGG